ncbi:hypothetical protein HDU67_005699, partial [Dinochytrium kinnereticum]
MKFISSLVVLGLAASSQAAPRRATQNSGSVNLGNCQSVDAQLDVGVGKDPANANELRAVVSGRGPFRNQGSALNFGIVANFICDRINDSCNLNAAQKTAVVGPCRTAQGALQALGQINGKRGDANALRQAGQAVDAFNKAIGATTDFTNSIAAAANNNGGNNNNNNNGGNNNAGNNNNNNGGNNNNNNQGGAAGLGNCNAADAQLDVGVGKDPANANELRAV